ncbi:hypothetical protein L207DRAFT_139867 [Hyaloscypha variabilis F]|uniref:Uncharacterized protein n=1 Tax=Hyaloscypha variabilis (strain UAMH 11265 / GT02V1 / F) TaxID=1149755 RepID=A0A2J6R799_HYAVF|nr:hypothetical protein L207DRAFT_139867 [Hyaloscypha variabilis F]
MCNRYRIPTLKWWSVRSFKSRSSGYVTSQGNHGIRCATDISFTGTSGTLKGVLQHQATSCTRPRVSHGLLLHHSTTGDIVDDFLNRGKCAICNKAFVLQLSLDSSSEQGTRQDPNTDNKFHLTTLKHTLSTVLSPLPLLPRTFLSTKRCLSLSFSSP